MRIDVFAEGMYEVDTGRLKTDLEEEIRTIERHFRASKLPVDRCSQQCSWNIDWMVPLEHT